MENDITEQIVAPFFKTIKRLSLLAATIYSLRQSIHLL